MMPWAPFSTAVRASPGARIPLIQRGAGVHSRTRATRVQSTGGAGFSPRQPALRQRAWAPASVARRNSLERDAGTAAEDHRGLGRGRSPEGCQFAFRMEQSLAAGGSHQDGRLQFAAQELRAEVHGAHIHQHARPQGYAVEGLAIAAQGPPGTGARSDALEQLRGEALASHFLDLEQIHQFFERRKAAHAKSTRTAERSMAAMVAQPVAAMAMASSAWSTSRTRRTPSGPKAPSPHSGGLPTSTARAPRARALKTSLPRRKPPSMSTGMRPPTACTISGSASRVDGA